MKSTAQIDSAGRVVVPKAFRDALHLRPGDRLRVRKEGDSLVLEPEQVFARTRIAEDGWPLLENRGGKEPLPLKFFNDLLMETRERRDRRDGGVDE
jgi:AbrB family looped-hinge helix DNA binding protein